VHVLMGFFFAMGCLIGLLPKNYEIPFPPKKITLFYTYTILHDHIKSYKCIDFYTYTYT